MNFGTIKDVYAKALVESYINESTKSDGKKKYSNFIKNITENDILRTQFIVYKNIENGYFESEVSAVEYLKENISLFDRFKKSNIIKENNKISSNISIDKSYIHNPLHEAIHNLIVLDKKAETLNKLHESFEVVKKWLTTPKTSEKIKQDNNIDVNKFLNVVVEKYNEKYSTISEEDKKILKTILSQDVKEKEELFNTLTKESLEAINNIIKNYSNNLEVKVKLLETKDTLYTMKFNNDTFKEDVLKLYDLKQSLS